MLVILLLLHPLTHPPHLKYVAQMTVVEANTFFLILRRHLHRGTRIVEGAFALTWIAIRVFWFPFLAVKLACCATNWGSGARRIVVTSSVFALAALQLQWTAQVIGKSPAWQRLRGSHAAEETRKASDAKNGFL